MNKVPEIKASRPNRNRNAFDLSQRHMFTASAGQLLPILSLDLLPHDHVEINANDFMRTLPMNTSAFVSMRSVYEFFFVPYKQLWSQFDQFITGMKDYRSNNLNKLYGSNSQPTQCPYFDVADVMNDQSANEQFPEDIFQINGKTNAVRLYDLLGYGRWLKSNGDPIDQPAKQEVVSVTPWRLLAYNKIYHDFYRNQNYEGDHVYRYNIDDHKGGKMDPRFVAEITEMYYRNAERDYFTNIRPSMLFTMPNSLVSHATLNLGFNEEFSGADRLSTDFVNHGADKQDTITLKMSGDSDNSYLNVSSLRAAFAVDKLLSVTMRAGKNFEDQMRAHYGVEIPHSRDGKVMYLGGFDSNVQVSDVDQTSGTTQTGEYSALGGYLGRTVGKGTASGSGHIEFDAKEHGVLMCIYSLVPAMNYDSLRIDPLATKLDRFDYFTPEFENLGMQPLQKLHVTMKGGDNSVVYGYQPRYSEYKTALDINHGQFTVDDALSYYTVSRFRGIEDSNPVLHQGSLKINPSCLDSIFPVKFNGKEVNDQMFGGCYFNIMKVSDMSVDGMPRV